SALEGPGGQPLQRLSAPVEQRQTTARALSQFPCACLGGVQAKNAGISGLGPRGVGTYGLAEIFGIALDVENIVLDLKRQTDVLRIGVEGVPFGRGQFGRTG